MPKKRMMLSSPSSSLNGSRVVGVINAQRRRVMPRFGGAYGLGVGAFYIENLRKPCRNSHVQGNSLSGTRERSTIPSHLSAVIDH